jgi:uncharacterized protein YndB with AHSA1/START domain
VDEKATHSTNTAGREICQERTFNAPRDLVFAAWTNPQALGCWWGPTGFTTTTHEMDFRPGGVWRFVMHGPDGVDYPNKITYLEIEPPARLVYDHSGDDDFPPHFRTTVTFVERGGKTALTMTAVFPSAAARELVVEKYGAIEGGKQTLARLAEYLEKPAKG